MQLPIIGQTVQGLQSLEELKTILGDIKRSFEKNLEQETCVSDFIALLSILMTPEKISISPQQETFIFEELIPGYAKRVLDVKTNNLKYALLLQESINNITTFFNFCLEPENLSFKEKVCDIADVMRLVFDTQQKFYQNHFQHELGGDAGKAEAKTNLAKFNDEEQLWRENLTVGTIVDAYKTDGNFRISCWSRGQVEELFKDSKGNTTTLKIAFMKDVQVSQINVPIDSDQIAPLGTKADQEEWNWRSQLKVGDKVDAMDRCSTWYLATVIVAEERLDAKFPNLKIGFREYASNGEKSDAMGFYFGFSEKMDEHIGSFTVRIQKPYTFCNKSTMKHSTLLNQTKSLITQNSQQDQTDLLMLSQPGDIIFSTERFRCKSSMLVNMINRFGAENGFTKILAVISQEQTPLNTVFFLVDAVAKLQEILHKSFIDFYDDKLRKTVEDKLMNSTQVQLRQMKRERIEELTSTLWDKILARLHTQYDTQVHKNILNLRIGVILLQLNFMEKRIDGAKMIDVICKQLNESTTNTTIANPDLSIQLIQILREKNVFQEFFSKQRCHAQLVQRSEGFLKLLIQKRVITEEELNLVWETCRADESIKIDLYKVLSDISLSLGPNETSFFIKKITSQKITQIKVQELDLLESLAKESSKKTDQTESLSFILDFFWHYLFDVEQHNNEKQLTLKAIQAFSEILKNVSKEVHYSYIQKLAQNLQLSIQGYLSIKILSRFIDQFVERSAVADVPGSTAYTKKDCIDFSEKNFNVLDNIFAYLQQYMSHVNQQICTMTPLQIEQLGDQASFDRFLHSDHIRESIDLIGNLVAAGGVGFVRLKLAHLETLWDLIIRNNLIVADHPMLYKWLRTLCDAVFKDKIELTTQEDLIQFFTNKTNDLHSDFINLSLEGYYCFQTYFILMNRREHKLILLGEEGKTQKLTSYNNQTGAQYKSFSFKPANNSGETDPETVEVMVKAEPNAMQGIQGLWKIAIDCLDKKVGECVTNLLLQLHTNVDFGMEDRIPLFEDQFISSCFGLIQEQSQKIKARSEEEQKKIDDRIAAIEGFRSREKIQKYLPVEEKRIIKCLTYIQMLIQNSEKDGVHSLRPHSSLNQGEFLKAIQINNSYKTGEGYRSKFEIKCHSNTTVYELKKLIAYELQFKQSADGSWLKESEPHPQTIKLSRFTTGTVIKDTLNGSTLAELKFKQTESISVSSKGFQSVSKVPLVNEDGTDINERAYFIFSELFEMYAIEDPDEPTRKIMRIEEITAFIKGATKETCSRDDSRVIFISGFDSNGDGKIEKDDFINFYKKSCFEKVDVVRQNLIQYNYNNALKQVPKSGQDDNVLQPRKTILQMPRYKLSNDLDAFNSLFDLLNLHKEVQTEAQALLQMLSSNPKYFWQTLWLKERPDEWGNFVWSEIFDTSDMNKLQYILEIVDSFIQCDPSLYIIESEEYILRYSWVKRFLQQGGFAQLVQVLPKIIDRQTEMSDLRLNLLDQILRIIKVFITGAIQADQSNPFPAKEETNTQQQLELQPLAEQYLAQEEKLYQSPEKQVQIPFLQQPQNEQHPEFIGPLRPPGKFDGTAASVTQELLFGDKNTTQVTTTNKEEQKNEVAIVVNEFENSPRFIQIVGEIRDLKLQDFIFSVIDFSLLQNDIISIVAKLTLQDINFRPSENAIISSGLALWTSILLKNPSLFTDFLSWQSEKLTASDFVRNGIYSNKSLYVRVAYKSAFELLAQRLPILSNQNPLNFILGVLTSSFPQQSPDEAKNKQTRDCNEFFALLIELIQLARKSNIQNNDKFDLKKFLVESIQRMKSHQSNEKPSSIFEDKISVGYISLVRELLPAFIEQTNYDEVIAFVQEHELLHEMFYENLYYVPGKTRNTNQNKCKVTNSRTIAYKLLYRYLKALKPKELVAFLKNDLGPMIKELPTPAKWLHEPSVKTRYQYSGIVNLGCICYMISMLQQFFMVPQFRYLLLRAEDNKAPNVQEWKGRQINDNLLVQLQRVFGYLEKTERQAVDPTDFIFAFKDFDGNPTNVAIQQDAQEFLGIFFDRIENQLKDTSQKYLVQDVFRGSNVSQLSCKECGKTFSRLQHYYNLSVEVKNKQNLYESLDKLLEPAEIQDYFCESCQKKVDVQQRTLIGETPNVLFVHLQRIIFSFETFNNEKINTKFEFPNLLDLRSYSFKQVIEKEGTLQPDDLTDELKELQQIDDDYYIYKLVGVNIHVGTADHGHYYSLINTNRGIAEVDPTVKESDWLNVEKDNWRVFNDGEVSFFSFKDMAAEAFGGNSSALSKDEVQNFLQNSEQSYGKSAYMLVYERKKKKSVRQILTGSEVNIEYRDVAQYMPDWLSKQVTKDNIEFVVDKQVFHPQFFNLVKLILQHIGSDLVLTQHQYGYEYLEHFEQLKTISLEIGQRVMFDFLSRYNEKDKSSIAPICEAMCNVVVFSESWISYCTQRGNNLIVNFIKQHYLQDNCKVFFELMFVCGDQQSRQYIAKFTAKIINRGFQIWGVLQQGELKHHERVTQLYQTLDQLMQLLLFKLHEKECQSNWSRLVNYFTLLYEIGIGGKWQTLYLLKNYDYVVDICDVMLGDKSPKARLEKEKRISMGGSVSMTPFGPLVALASHLIRSAFTKQMMISEEVNISTLTVFANDESSKEPKQILDQKFLISDEAFAYFTDPILIDFIMLHSFQEEEYGKALTHLCFDDEKLSKKVCKILLKAVVNSDYDKIKPYLVIISQMLKIKDNKNQDLQQKRLEWILGFGFLRSVQTESNVRVGMETTFHNIKEEIFMMKSMITYDSENESSLLHLLWRYQGRMDTYTVYCLEDLVQIIASDDKIKHYFAQLPGMTYQYARYSDWIKPYLQNLLKNSQNTLNSTYYQNIKETSQRVLDLYKNYEEYISKIDTVELNPEILPCTPKRFVILKQTANETYLESFYEKNGVNLSLSFVECQYVWSQPTGKSNNAIGPKFLHKYSRTTTNTDLKVDTLNKSAAAMLKERDQQLGVDPTSPNLVKKQTLLTQPQNLQGDTNDKNQAATNIDMQNAPYFQMIEAVEGEDSDDSLKGWDGDQIYDCADLIYKLTLSNATNTPICFKIKMGEGSFGPINLQWPSTGIKGTLDVGETSVVAVLQKMRPETPNFIDGRSEIEKLNILLDWKLNEKKMKQIASQSQAAQNASALRTTAKPANGSVRFTQDVTQVGSQTVYPEKTVEADNYEAKEFLQTNIAEKDFHWNPSDFGGYDLGGANASEKSCAACTVMNPATATECYLCTTTFLN